MSGSRRAVVAGLREALARVRRRARSRPRAGVVHRLARGAVVSTALLAAALAALHLLDRLYPPDLGRAARLAQVLDDRDGRPLRYHLASDDRLRIAVDVEQVDARFVDMLVAYEDKRFWSHPGVDPLAVARAAAQWLWHGRPVSGASTLTMQTARLLEPRPRTLASKLLEMGRALQLERRLDKRGILALYLRLAPYGGNLEGVEAASRHWFGHAPAALTPAEAALLVALPQSPARLRPDRHPRAALAARAKVLERVWPAVAGRHGLGPTDLRLARGETLGAAPTTMPALAPHLADRLLGAEQGTRVRSCLDADLQRRVTTLARAALRGLHPRASVAVLVVHNASAEVRAYLGGPDYLSAPRAGQVDLVTATRSPGSTLKPFVYGLAFEHRLAAPATRVLDRPTRFGGYVPANFEHRYHGSLSVAEALRLSLNVPAVALMEAVGPARFQLALARQGVPLALPGDGRPGLAVALGGAGTSLESLVRLYRGLADDGSARALRLRCDRPAPAAGAAPLLGARARWHLARILREVAPPRARLTAGAADGGARRVAYKTGTSYGYRDAWSVGFDAQWTVGVWVGRADGTPLPGVSGHAAAAPILFGVFDELPQAPAPPHRAPPPGALEDWDPARLPPALLALDAAGGDGGPRVLFPLPGTSVLMRGDPLRLESAGGTPPYTWLVDGAPLARTPWPVQQWRPIGPGFVVATVVDAEGRADRVRFRVTDALAPAVGRLRPSP